MHRPRFDLPGLSAGFVADVVRVDIETDPAGLVNLVQNPDGRLGGFGWLAPTAGTVVRGSSPVGGQALEFVTASSSLATLYATELMPVTTSGYVAAQWTEKGFTDLSGTAMPTGYYRARFSWYDASGTQTGVSTQSGYYQISASGVVRSYAATAVPAGVTHARLRFDAYSNTSAANPTANRIYAISDVRVATAATTGGLQVITTNLIPNPSFETNATGWEAGSVSSTVARSTAQAYTGSASLLVSTGPSGGTRVAQTSALSITPSTTYSFQCRTRAVSTSGSGSAVLQWFNAGMTALGVNVGSVTAHTFSGWTHHTVTATAPATAAYVRARVYGSSSGETYYVDAAMLERGDASTSYFDGSTTDTGTSTYDWTGTANASTSTRTTTDLSGLVPVEYVNITGESKGVSLTRDALDVGTLTVEVVDASLDPAEADLIRPGRRCRLQALDSAGEWGVIYTGRLTGAQVSYPLLNPEADGKANITVTAVDNVATLAAAERPDSVATIDELPYVLEGCGVPWNANGNTGQVGAATVRATSDGATAVDQVAMTRDSAHGFAWVDQLGILHAWDADEIDTTPVLTLDEDTYSDVVIGFDTDACINECTVTVRSVDNTGQTVETVSTYTDADSIAQWGRHRAEFTVLTPTNPATFAAEVLAANATPEIRISEVLLSVRDADTIDLAHLDLFDAVTLVNTEKGISEVAFITGITHTITRDKWLMSVRFASPTAVASPQVVPPLKNGAVGVLPFSMAAGNAVVSVSSSTNGVVAVTFPTDRFTATPMVTATAYGASFFMATTSAADADGCNIVVRHIDGTSSTTNVNVRWVAVQMTDSAGAG